MPPLNSWFSIPPSSDFSLSNLPIGIISTPEDATPRPSIAIGLYAFDLKAFTSNGGFLPIPEIHSQSSVFCSSTLNAFAAQGRPFHRLVRTYIQSLFLEEPPHPQILRDNVPLQEAVLIPLEKTTNHLPLTIGDYTDFFAGRNHAYNAGVLFRGPENALQPNYLHLPVAYHSRASSVVVSGTAVRRPWGQRLPAPSPQPATTASSSSSASASASASIAAADGKKPPEFAPCRVLDMELELGMFLCRGNKVGEPIPLAEADEYIFGYVLLNDWSARDFQAWEYVPLGPFNAKNFATSISAWVVMADALEPWRVEGLKNETTLLPYLSDGSGEKRGLDIDLEVAVRPAAAGGRGGESVVTRTNARELIWSFPQMIAHHTITGCNLRTGDLFGSGTISGTTEGSLGSFLEMTKAGKESFRLDGEDKGRTYLEDGDEVVLRGRAGREGEWVGFGECRGLVLPAHDRK